MYSVGFKGTPGPRCHSLSFSLTWASDVPPVIYLQESYSGWDSLFSNVPLICNMHIGGPLLSGASFEWKVGVWGLLPFAESLAGVLHWAWLFPVLRQLQAE